jgi:hypothetical protein
MTGVLVFSESRCDRDADIEAPACTAQVAVLPPAQISLHLVNRLESAALNEALAQAERHAGIIGPFARLQAERPAMFRFLLRLDVLPTDPIRVLTTSARERPTKL